MASWRVWSTVTAITVSISINLIITIVLGLNYDWEEMIAIGLILAPILGGVIRSSVAYRKDIKYIVFAMLILDALLFVPIVFVITGLFDGDYLSGMAFGAAAGGIQLVVGLITWGIRIGFSQMSDSKNIDDQIKKHRDNYRQY